MSTFLCCPDYRTDSSLWGDAWDWGTPGDWQVHIVNPETVRFTSLGLEMMEAKRLVWATHSWDRTRPLHAPGEPTYLRAGTPRMWLGTVRLLSESRPPPTPRPAPQWLCSPC